MHELSDQELCQAWRRSFLTLTEARYPVERLRLVVLRQTYLDELERRSPGALAAWLSSGPRAAGSPARHLLDRPGRSRARDATRPEEPGRDG